MKSLKKMLCFLLTFSVLLSAVGSVPVIAQAAKSDSDLIMNLDLQPKDHIQTMCHEQKFLWTLLFYSLFSHCEL